MMAQVRYKSSSGRDVSILELWLDDAPNTPFPKPNLVPGAKQDPNATGTRVATFDFGSPSATLVNGDSTSIQGTKGFPLDTTAWTDGSHTLFLNMNDYRDVRAVEIEISGGSTLQV